MLSAAPIDVQVQVCLRRSTSTTDVKGQRVAWADIVDAHLWDIALTMTYSARAERRGGWCEKLQDERMCAVDELDFRGLLPTVEDLRVAWDVACGGQGGPDIERRPWCLVELWTKYRPVRFS
jgi:hypothetical protein